MRISDNAKWQMKNKILDDMYAKAEIALTARQVAIAKKNREYYFEPYLPLLDKLPPELISYHTDFCVGVSYNQNAEEINRRLNATWRYTADRQLPNPQKLPIAKHSIGYPADTALDPRLYKEAAVLAEDIITLRNERDELTDFLTTTLENFSGSNQLKKAWPESLHKYLPATVARTKKAKPEPVAVPETISTRLVTNLLEGN